MLVLSRRPDEKILLPSVPAIIKVISSQASLVRLGFEAPSHIPILRAELCRGDRSANLPESSSLEAEESSPGVRHSVRNRLNNLTLGLALLRRQVGDADPKVQRTLEGIEEEVRRLHLLLAGSNAERPEAALATP